MTPTQTQPSIKQLAWRCRRGSKELDLILSGFITHHYEQLTTTEQKLFAQLLEQPDPQLSDWLCHRKTPTNQGMVTIVKLILSTHRS